MIHFTSAGGKIVRHLFPRVDLFYFGMNHDYPEVLKGEFKKAENGTPIYLVKNFKGQFKISSSDKFGTVVLSFDDILNIAKTELSKDRPGLDTLVSIFNDYIENL